MKNYDYQTLSSTEIKKICTRNSIVSEEVQKKVREISKRVQSYGDKAIRELTKEIDRIKINDLKVSEQEISESINIVEDDFKNAVKQAKSNIWKFHSSQKPQKPQKIETSEEVYCWQEFRPIEKVGLYIPSGTAPLFSTVLMLGIPAILSGCQEISICTPPQKDGKISPEILYTANLLGIHKIYKVGGAQAIFSLAFGTQTIPQVSKIFGPGNIYVTAAKMQVSSFTAIDMPAGPSEVLVISDKNSKPSFVAADLLSQAEHGADSQVVLVYTKQEFLQKVLEEIEIQVENLPRKDLAISSLKNSLSIQVPDLETAFEFSNLYAPEHLILSFENYEKYLEKIQNAGSVFCGPYSPESFGDYASGTNHTLPTSGFAKSYSGLSIKDFTKSISFQEVSQTGFENLANIVEIMAEKENLTAHKNAVSIRKNSLS